MTTPVRPREILAAGVHEYGLDRIVPLLNFMDEELPGVDATKPDIRKECNNRLSTLYHNDLLLSKTVTVAPLLKIPNPANENDVGRFGYGFLMIDYIDGNAVPVGMNELNHMYVDGMRGRDNSRHYADHRSRPCFWRALSLEMNFFVELTWSISSGERPLETYGPEIFVAYQVMSKLIDRRDPGAMKGDSGIPMGERGYNRGYLFKKNLLLVA